jgi:tetratricopeptide (TPR) repeat protein
MAERMEEPEAEGSPGGTVAADGGVAAGIALALGKARPGAALPPEAAEFLKRQGRLVELQMEHLHEQRELVLSRLRWGRFSDRVKAAIQVMTALVGLVVAVAIGAMAWRAHEDHGVAIAAFSVPPDFAQKGLTGQVIASQVLDRLSDLQAQTVTARPASTYANDWGGDIKVEIPETGVSLGELNRYLREWLGSQTRITGEIVRTAAGVAVTARAGEASGRRFEGQEADIGKLVDQAAEAIYGETQPYRYAVWLSAHGRANEAQAAFARLTKSGSADERAWAYAGWSSMLFGETRMAEAARAAQNAVELNPRLYPAYPILGNSLYLLGREQAALEQSRREVALLESGRAVGLPKSQTTSRLKLARGLEAFIAGDEQAAAALPDSRSSVDFEGQAGAFTPFTLLALSLSLDHDVAGTRKAMAAVGQGMVGLDHPPLDEWSAFAAEADAARARAPSAPDVPYSGSLMAEAYARAGRLADAEAILAKSPQDCSRCLRLRGLVAALKQDWPAADRWYAEAARQSPSLPFALAEWGQALIGKGDIDGAIARFEQSHRINPHFADPIEFWGEALMRKRDYAGAVAKFAEADKYAPKWGRNHLRWGEALMLASRYAEARRQYEAANGLGLSRADRASLDVLLARTAAGPLHG